MKLTLQQLLSLAAAAGVPRVEMVDDEADSDFDLDHALQAIDTARTEVIRPRLEMILKPEIESRAAGKFGGSLKRMLIRETGIEGKKLEGLRDEEALKAALAHRDDLSARDKQALQQLLDEATMHHDGEIDRLQQEHAQQLRAAQERYTDRDIDSYLAEQLRTAPLPATADRHYVAKQLKSYLKEKYALSYDEANRTVELHKKDDPATPALNADGTARINILDEAKEMFAPMGLWRTDMRDVNPQDAMSRTQTQSYKPTGSSPAYQPRLDPSHPLHSLNSAREAFIKSQEAA